MVWKKKQTDISGLATKTSLNDYLKTLTFNSKLTEEESKIKDTDIILYVLIMSRTRFRVNSHSIVA